MTKRQDMGMRVAAAAKVVTPDQVAELVAIRLSQFHPKDRCPILRSYQGDELHGPLEQAGIIEWQDPRRGPGWRKKQWGVPVLAEFGERVLLNIAEDAMIEAGRMKSLDPAEWKDAA